MGQNPYEKVLPDYHIRGKTEFVFEVGPGENVRNCSLFIPAEMGQNPYEKVLPDYHIRGKKEGSFSKLDREKMGEIVACLSQLRWDKILTKKCFQTITSEEKRGSVFEVGPGENERNCSLFIPAEMGQNPYEKVLPDYHIRGKTEFVFEVGSNVVYPFCRGLIQESSKLIGRLDMLSVNKRSLRGRKLFSLESFLGKEVG